MIFIKKKINVSWIYFFYPSSFLKSINYARNYIDHINHLSKNTYKHQLIENYFTKLDVIKCLVISFFHFLKI